MEGPQNIILLIVIGCISMILMAAIVVLFVALYKRNMLQKENEIKIIEQQQQIALFKASVEIEEQQKEKIARNLHDEINPLLAVLKFNLSKHRIEARKDKFDPDSLIADTSLLDKAIEGIRTTCLDLIPSFLLQYGLVKSLEQYLDHVQQIGHVEVEFENNIPDDALNSFEKQDQLNTYRICLEILNNIFKHAACTRLKMNMSFQQQQLVIHISHNGLGVSNTDMDHYTETSKGLGLKSLKARALILNSTINYLKETPYSSVTLSIPYTHG
ncbi:MAG: ATP-binding protein [Bacteroidota bacterium]